MVVVTDVLGLNPRWGAKENYMRGFGGIKSSSWSWVGRLAGVGELLKRQKLEGVRFKTSLGRKLVRAPHPQPMKAWWFHACQSSYSGDKWEDRGSGCQGKTKPLFEK
jgi:hypothetical protein